MMKPTPQTICVASTMRSGSTLLKALLAEAPDISNLPEKDFQKYYGDPKALEKISALDEHPIVVLKRPGWYNEIGRYPRIPKIEGLKTVLLIRDAYETVESLRKMTFRKAAPWMSRWVDGWLAKRYWLGMTQSLWKLHEDEAFDTYLVRYEDLTQNPIDETKKLFEFVGSKQQGGVDTYSKPDGFRWRWGSDDNSANIKSLRVQSRPAKPRKNSRLVDLLNDPKVADLRARLGYT